MIGYHASHEQFSPSELLHYVQRAEAAGFQGAMASDHFAPWSERQGQSGFVWSWLGAALATTSLSFGTVNAPGQRYHPTIVAQAVATLSEMFPGRLWLAVGSGQYLNEHITGERWPSKAERNARLEECVTLMRALWRGETVTHKGLVSVHEARLHTSPGEMPLVVGAAVTSETARWLASWADALITIAKPPDELEAVVEAFREGGGEGKPMFLQVQLAYADTLEEARAAAHDQWRTNIFESPVLANLPSPEAFDAASSFVRAEDMHPHVRVSHDLEQHLAWLQEDLALGFERLYLHHVGREQARFIDAFGEGVLPKLEEVQRD
jgi:probable non-F420 flavinoid oxidoreductase